MHYPSLGGHRSVAEFRRHWQSMAAELDCDDVVEGATGPLARPFDLAGRVIGNRWCVHPMEGWDGTEDGRPGEHTLRRWRRFGRSGAKLLWGGEAFAVREDGRANPRQLCLGAHAVGDLTRLREQVFEGHTEVGGSTDDLYCGLQLTHSGRFAHARPRIASHHPVMDARVGLTASDPVLTDAELEEIGDCFVVAAHAAAEAGFEFVDVKCCHGYLLHELLGAHTREGDHGGSLENRTRLLRRILDGIRQEVPGLGVAVRVSIAEVHPFTGNDVTGIGEPRDWQQHVPYRHGFGVDPDDPRRFEWREPFALLEMLSDLGVRLVSLSLGSPYTCAHLQRPAAYPPSDGYLPPVDPLHGVAQHILAVRRCRERFPELALVGTGYSYLQDYLPHVAQHEVRHGHVDFVGLGRMVLSYPELPRDVLQGRPLERRRICRTFSDCTTGPRNDMISGCYPLDEHYRGRPEASRVRELRAAMTTRMAEVAREFGGKSTMADVTGDESANGGEVSDSASASRSDDRIHDSAELGDASRSGEPGVLQRLAFAAAHVVMKSSYAAVAHAPDRPGSPDEIVEFLDLDATMNVRRFLDAQGFGIAEAMDTAQRFSIGEAGARRLIEACGAAGLANGFIAGAGADGLADDAGDDRLIESVVRQGRHIREHGGWVILLPMVQLSRAKANAKRYVDVYREIVSALDGPLFVHWLGEMFAADLRGYFPGDSFDQVMALDPGKVRGCKLSLLDPERERAIRGSLLPREQIVLTGDDWNFSDLILGESTAPPARTRIGSRDVALGDFSHALLGVLDAVAEPAGRALRHLADGDREKCRMLLKPCEALGRILFEPPVHHYKTGLAFLSWLNGRQDNFMLVNHEERGRDHDHMIRLVESAVQCGALDATVRSSARWQDWNQPGGSSA